MPVPTWTLGWFAQDDMPDSLPNEGEAQATAPPPDTAAQPEPPAATGASTGASTEEAAASASAPVPAGPEPWERAAAWLTALGIMPSVEGICEPELFDFVVFLKNGVVLCEAINAIFPAKVEYDENPIETVWQKQNINHFLAACSELELPAENLFDAEDLNDGADVHSVLKTLASLSQLEAAQAKGIACFEITEAPDECRDDYTKIEDLIQSWSEQIYGLAEADDVYAMATENDQMDGLYEMASNGDPEGIYGLPPSFDAGSSIYEMVDNKRLYENAVQSKQAQGGDGKKPEIAPGGLYLHYKKVAKQAEKKGEGEGAAEAEDPLAWERRIEAALAAQPEETFKDDEGGEYNLVTACDQIMGEAPEEPNLYTDDQTSKHRNHALKELAETENNYCGVLKALVEVYQTRISQHPDIFSEADQAILFTNVPYMHENHEAFAALLDVQMQSQTGRVIGPLFKKSIDAFKAYAEYCCRMPAAIDKYEELRAANPEADRIFEECKAASGRGFPFRVLLNVPMQRVLKYPLLLRELVKGTPDQHEDADGLDAAKEALAMLAKLVNETMRTYENILAVQKMLTGYDGAPLTDYYAFYMFQPQPARFDDGEMAYKGCGDKDKVAKRYVFLLPRAIVVCQAGKGGKYVFKQLVAITDKMTVDHAMNPKGLTSGKFKFPCCITDGDGGQHHLTAKAESTKNRWIAMIRSNVGLIQKSLTAPLPKIKKPPKKEEPKPAPAPANGAAPASSEKPAAPAAAAVKKAPAQQPNLLSQSFALYSWFAGDMTKEKAAEVLRAPKTGPSWSGRARRLPGRSP